MLIGDHKAMFWRWWRLSELKLGISCLWVLRPPTLATSSTPRPNQSSKTSHRALNDAAHSNHLPLFVVVVTELTLLVRLSLRSKSKWKEQVGAVEQNRNLFIPGALNS